jgi:hypothetical protein
MDRDIYHVPWDQDAHRYHAASLCDFPMNELSSERANEMKLITWKLYEFLNAEFWMSKFWNCFMYPLQLLCNLLDSSTRKWLNSKIRYRFSSSPMYFMVSIPDLTQIRRFINRLAKHEWWHNTIVYIFGFDLLSL